MTFTGSDRYWNNVYKRYKIVHACDTHSPRTDRQSCAHTPAPLHFGCFYSIDTLSGPDSQSSAIILALSLQTMPLFCFGEPIKRYDIETNRRF